MGTRNVIYWEKVRGLRATAALVTGTALGAGLVPVAPGTMGTLFAIPLAYFTREWPWPARVALWLGLTAAGTWAAKVLDELMQTGDNQCIVVDEVVGLGITAWTITGSANSAWAWLAAFVLFRVFDIVKLPPVRQLDHWSKKKARENTPLARWWGGSGVMGDDILAGFQGLIVMIVLQWLHVLPR